jgi:hypothetical protein
MSVPRSAGYEADRWTGALVVRLVFDLFNVRYSRGHVWRLLRAINQPPTPDRPPLPPGPPPEQQEYLR